MRLRRLFRYRLRTLLVLMAVLSVWLGVYVRSARRQEEAVQAIRDYGGWVNYDYQFPSGDYSSTAPDLAAESPVPKWLLDWAGVDLFHTVVKVSLNYSTDSGQREENANLSDYAPQHLPKLPNLRILLLERTQATDESMVHLASLKKLERLYMWDAFEVSDAGVQHLRNLKNLRYVHLSNTGQNLSSPRESRVTDASLRVFGQLESLEGLSLQGSRFTDEGLSYLVGLDELTVLWVGLGDNKITNAGLPYLCQLERLETLGLQHTQVTAEGLEQLAVLQNLKRLSITEEKVGDLTQLKAVLSGCKIR